MVELNQHIGDEACREFLQKGKSSKIAKQLLALTAADFTTATRPILLQVLQQRAAAAQLDFR